MFDQVAKVNNHQTPSSLSFYGPAMNHPLAWQINEIVIDFFGKLKNLPFVSSLKYVCQHEGQVFHIQAGSEHYALQFWPASQSLYNNIQQYYMMLLAAEKGVGPIVHHNKNDAAVLTSYAIDGPIRISAAHDKENCRLIAKALVAAHATPLGILKQLTQQQDIHHYYKKAILAEPNNESLKLAMGLINHISNLGDTNTPCVRLHGYLHPHNIILSNRTVHFIGWQDNSLGDPFSDLAFLSIIFDFDTNEEEFLLESYLERKPCLTDLKHLTSMKQINLAHLFMRISLLLQKKLTDDAYINLTPSGKQWSDLVRSFALEGNNLPAQTLYDLANAAFCQLDAELLRKVNLNDYK